MLLVVAMSMLHAQVIHQVPVLGRRQLVMRMTQEAGLQEGLPA